MLFCDGKPSVTNINLNQKTLTWLSVTTCMKMQQRNDEIEKARIFCSATTLKVNTAKFYWQQKKNTQKTSTSDHRFGALWKQKSKWWSDEINVIGHTNTNDPTLPQRLINIY